MKDRLMRMISRRVTCALPILVGLLLYSGLSMADIGIPHFIYGKVFNSDGSTPSKDDTEVYAYILPRPDELLDTSVVGCGYDVWFDGWLWFETGNCVTPWSINENVRVIAVDNLLQETGAIDLTLDSSGNQLLSDLTLAPGDNVGPIASNTLANGDSPLTIPLGTPTVTLTAKVDDSITGDSIIQAAECYADADLGVGSGISMDATDGIFSSSSEDVDAIVDTSSWTEGSTYSTYVRGKDSDNNWGAPHMVVVSIGPPLAGDLNIDGQVCRSDLNIILSHRNQPASVCPECDLDEDGTITVLDARKLVLLCTKPRCACEW